jgi:hypothetical protein
VTVAATTVTLRAASEETGAGAGKQNAERLAELGRKVVTLP